MRNRFAWYSLVPLLWALAFAASQLATVAQTTQPAKPVDFNRDIRPILSDTCFTCHGPDEQAQQAGLRLDTKEGAFADRGGYQVIVPGKASQSRLFQRISAKEEALRMPPPTAERKLTESQIELLRRWIDEGAKVGHALGLHSAEAPFVAQREKHGLDQEPHRCLHSGAPGTRGPEAVAASRQDDAAATAEFRSHRIAAHTG
ncbi:MAG: hypothetical protein L0387_31470 [Acidobacteria bacterium]|nr:hypothetical protein [Acidobacteriota bacterium]MCI0723565.1 hypothetical protein [Acidobacteriota bacterium]